jgi:hypothetical protein
MAVMFEWRHGRVVEHTIMSADVTFGYNMIREFRKLFGEEDSTAESDGCNEYIWRRVKRRRYWVIVCPSAGYSTANAQRL